MSETNALIHRYMKSLNRDLATLQAEKVARARELFGQLEYAINRAEELSMEGTAEAEDEMVSLLNECDRLYENLGRHAVWLNKQAEDAETERDTLAAIVAAVEAEIETWPDHPRTLSTFLTEADCEAYMARYEARQQLERVMADARKSNGD